MLYNNIVILGFYTVKKVDSMSVEMLRNTMEKDPTDNRDDALMLLYQHLRTGEAPSVDVAAKFIEKMFFSTKKYDLGSVGRYRINKKLMSQVLVLKKI